MPAGRPKKIVYKTYKCLCCGSSWETTQKFYVSKFSQIFKSNDGCCSICKDCVDELFDNLVKKYNSVRKALMVVMHYLDMPFIRELYDDVKKSSASSRFPLGVYIRRLNTKQFSRRDFSYSIFEGELTKTVDDTNAVKEERWDDDEIEIRDEVIRICGYDPFRDFNNNDRRFLFTDFAKYIDDDMGDDPYLLSQTQQIVINNNLIRNYDRILSRLDPLQNSVEYQQISNLKSTAIQNNDKIAKENGIAVKHRSNTQQGAGTLTGLMMDLRNKDIEEVEEDYYAQLCSKGTRWAAEMSTKAILTNAGFDENDNLEIKAKQTTLIDKLYRENDDLKELNRKLMIRIKDMGGTLDGYSETSPEEPTDDGGETESM